MGMRKFIAEGGNTRKVIGLILLMILICALIFEVAYDVFVFTIADRPETITGSIVLQKSITSDPDFIQEGITFLENNELWKDGAFLVSMSRNLSCSQINNPPNIMALHFSKLDRRSLITFFLFDADVVIDSVSMQITYTFSDGQPIGIRLSKVQDPIDLSYINIDSNSVLHLVELNGGSSIRTEVNDNCWISIYLGGDKVWMIDYINDDYEHLACFNVSSENGVLTQINKRDFKYCKNPGVEP